MCILSVLPIFIFWKRPDNGAQTMLKNLFKNYALFLKGKKSDKSNNCNNNIIHHRQTNRQTNSLTQFTGGCRFFLPVKFAASLLALLAGGQIKVLKMSSLMIHVTSSSSIPYYSNLRLISKMYLEQNSLSITLDIHASMKEHPPHLFRFKPHSANKISCHFFYYPAFLSDLVSQLVFEPDF